MRNVVCVLIILALSICAFAANANLNLMSPGKLDGKQLTEGSYKLAWTSEGENVPVTVSGNGVKMTVPASIIHSQDKLSNVTLKGTDGTIQEVHVAGKNLILKFNAANAPKNN